MGEFLKEMPMNPGAKIVGRNGDALVIAHDDSQPQLCDLGITLDKSSKSP